MQGQADGQTQVPSTQGQERPRRYRRYASTLVVIAVPALVAGMAAGLIASDAKGRGQPIDDLAVRAELIRQAQIKIQASAHVRNGDAHLPVDDISQAQVSETPRQSAPTLN